MEEGAAGGGGGGQQRLVAAGGDNECGSCEGGLIFYGSGAVKKQWLASKIENNLQTILSNVHTTRCQLGTWWSRTK